MSRDGRRSLGEWAVLGLLSEQPAHPFALSRHLGPGGPLGRVLTVRRSLVYRAVGRLETDGLATAQRTEPGESGPERTVYAMLRRMGRPVEPLVTAQQKALAETLTALDRLPDGADDTDVWRHHSAVAVSSFLDDLGRRG